MVKFNPFEILDNLPKKPIKFDHEAYRVELSKKTIMELRKEAEAKGVKGLRSGLGKGDYINRLIAHAIDQGKS